MPASVTPLPRAETSTRAEVVRAIHAHDLAGAAAEVAEHLRQVAARRVLVVHLGAEPALLARRGIERALALRTVGRVARAAARIDDGGSHRVAARALDPALAAAGVKGGAKAGAGEWVLAAAPAGQTARGDRVVIAATGDRVDADELAWLAAELGARAHHLDQLAAAEAQRQALEREVAVFRGVLDAVPDPVVLADAENRVVFTNERAEDHFAELADQSEGRRRALSLNRMLLAAALSGARDANAPVRELPLVDPNDGSDRLFELITSEVRRGGPLGGVVAVLRNVTDVHEAVQEVAENYRRLRVAEAEVRAERDRLDVVIDSVADPILVTGPDGAILLMNRPAEHLFTVEEPASVEETQRVRTNDARFSSHVSNAFITSEPRVRGHLDLFEPQSGRSFPVEAASGKLLSEHGEVTAVVTILHDRSEAEEKQRLYEQVKEGALLLEEKVRDATAELVHQNELLRRQHIELEQASNLKSQFVATMSHEFRTPLNAILGYTSMLLEDTYGELNPAQRRGLTRVDSNGKHLLSIINDILDISRIEAGSMPVNRSELEVPQLVGEVLSEVEPLARRPDVKLEAEVDAGIPLVVSDRAKVKQVLVNLVTNALKFTAQGSVTVRAAVVASAAGPRVVLAVRDTGIGIKAEDQELIFQDFRQADNSSTRRYGGAGLGLAICRRLATVLGGTISLESEPGEGSTFSLELPVGEADEA